MRNPGNCLRTWLIAQSESADDRAQERQVLVLANCSWLAGAGPDGVHTVSITTIM